MRLSNRYEIEVEIATGGMGTVYRGRDERLHRSVAIKVLRDHLSTDDRFVERFRREARAVASLSHPNIASLYDYGEDEGRHYIVMEFIDGRDLATILRDEGPIEPQRAERLAAQICDALAIAHAAGIVHRDVKPANVLLTSDGNAKVTDFGIARATGDSTLTMTGSILGTAHYLAPEQAAGEPATPATDVYATGIVLFEMLTGKVPFTADSPVVVASRHMNDEVPTPSSVAPGIPQGLDDVVRAATAKEPRDRYRDAAAMGAALRGTDVVAATPAAAAPTEALPARGGHTAPLPVHPVGSFNVRRLALAVTGGLLVLALALLAYRLVEDPAAGERRAPATQSSPQETESAPEPEPVAAVPDVLRQPVDDAVKAVNDAGLEPAVVGAEGGGIVVGLEPEPGSEVPLGTTVTLAVAEEDSDDDDEDEDDEDRGPPPHSEGKGKGKEKKDK